MEREVAKITIDAAVDMVGKSLFVNDSWSSLVAGPEGKEFQVCGIDASRERSLVGVVVPHYDSNSCGINKITKIWYLVPLMYK